jgi:hypothetical protein
MLSIVDPHGSWFKKWVLSSFGRSALFPIMAETETINHVARSFILNLDKLVHNFEFSLSPKEINEKFVINENDTQFITCINAILILGKFLMYSQGRSCFPVSLPQDQIKTSWIRDQLQINSGTSQCVLLTEAGFLRITAISMTRYSFLGLIIGGQSDAEGEKLNLGKSICELFRELELNTNFLHNVRQIVLLIHRWTFFVFCSPQSSKL